MISVFGSTGFVGGTFSKIYCDNVIRIPRDDRNPQSNTIVYFLSTNTNYNIFQDSHLDVNTNLNILLEVLDNCRGKEITFNYISTGFVYGNDILNAKETDYCNPGGFYSITKRAAEQLLVSYCNTFNLEYRIIRCSSVYGDDKNKSNKKNVLGHMINLLKKDEDILLYDNGKYYRDYTHVNDVAVAIKKIIDCGELNSVYNLGTGDARLYRDIIYMAKDILSSNSKISSIETPDFYKKSQAKNFTLNVEKLKSLGFVPSISFEDGLKELCLLN